jgi:oxygen-independent coproporphyrinogen-3 oxidase
MRTERPDAPELVDAAAVLVAAYVHIPFCRRICPYCDFAVQVGGDPHRYIAALRAEIAAADPFPRPLDAVYVGGGTPTSIPAPGLAAVLAEIADRFGLVAEAEISLEANPEDVTPRAAAAWREAGFNRISLGVQSLDAVTLAALGRGHDPGTAREALAVASREFPSVNADLIFGTPGDRGWADSVAGVLGAGIDHLSVYALTVERGTALSRAVAGGAPAPDPDAQADDYQAAAVAAAAAGLVRYETSNYARPGHACVYNLITWAQGEYAAFGNGAHRHVRGVRSWNVRRVDRYQERVLGGGNAVSGSERLGAWEREVERVLLGLRRAAGVRPGVAGAALLSSPEGERLVAAGVLEVAADRIRVARPLLGDAVSRSLLALEPVEC